MSSDDEWAIERRPPTVGSLDQLGSEGDPGLLSFLEVRMHDTVISLGGTR